MKLLLDTHVFLWSLLEPERLNRDATTELSNPENQIWLSPISVWETMILAERGRVVLRPDPAAWLRGVLGKMEFHEARITYEIALRSRDVRLRHQGPADRFLAATAMVYQLTLVTADRQLFGCRDISVLKATNRAMNKRVHGTSVTAKG
jgi:PIN domain nuclease of toxin-antitoxin system